MGIVAGRFKGKALAGPKSDAVRPTSDRLRETVFNILEHGYGEPAEGVRVLDLFAGTGALGLEALSRGAGFCLFVEEAAAARAVIRQNVETLGLTGTTRIYRRDAARLGEAGTLMPFSLVFADPPYRKGLAEAALAAAAAGGWLLPGALIVVEEAADAGFAAPDRFAERDRRRVGDSEVVFLRFDEAG